MTTRSGFMKSSTAAPCLRNSGLLTTLNGCVVSAAIDGVHLLRRADRHGALVDDDLVLVHRAADRRRATSSTCVRSAEPSSPCGVPTAMKTISAAWTAAGRSVVKRQPLVVVVPADHLLEAGLVDRHLALRAASRPWRRPCPRRRRRCRFRRGTRRAPGRRTLFPRQRFSFHNKILRRKDLNKCAS